MPLTILDDTVDQLAETLAARRHTSKADAVKLALEKELGRLDAAALPLRERIRAIQDSVLAWPATGLEADKAFYDELSGDE